MTTGLRIINNLSRLLIDQDYSNARLVQAGTLPAGLHSVPLQAGWLNDAPIVMVRPSVVESFVGACNISRWAYGYTSGQSVTNGVVTLGGQHSFSYAIFTTNVGPVIQDNSTQGLRVFRANGSVAYDSRERHPQVTHIFYKPQNGTANSAGYPNNYTVSGLTQIPWMLANPLLLTELGVGEYTENAGAVMAKVNSGLNTITIDLRNWNAWPPSSNTFPRLEPSTTYTTPEFSPYRYTPGYFGIGYYD